MDLLIAPNTVPAALADAAPTTGTPGYATDGNPATNTPATIFPAYAFNAIQAELLGIIAAAGITPDRTKTNQITAALQVMFQGARAVTAPDAGSANAYAMNLQPAISAYTPGMIVSIQNIKATNTGASTLSINGLPALPIYGPAATAMQGGELAAGYGAILRVNAAATAFELVATTGGSLPVKAATQSGQAVNLGQFLGPITNAYFLGTLAANNTYTCSVSFAAPSAGYVWGQSRLTLSGVASSEIQNGLLINGTQYQADNTFMPMIDCGVVQVSQGQSVTVTAEAVTGSTAPGVSASLHVDAIFIPALQN